MFLLKLEGGRYLWNIRRKTVEHVFSLALYNIVIKDEKLKYFGISFRWVKFKSERITLKWHIDAYSIKPLNLCMAMLVWKIFLCLIAKIEFTPNEMGLHFFWSAG